MDYNEMHEVTMKLSMEQVAQVLQKSKKTIYNHKDKNKFSYEIDEEGKTVVDVSEVLRVYGSSPQITSRLKNLESPQSEVTPDYNDKSVRVVKDSERSEYKIKIMMLEAALEKETALKENAEESLSYFKGALEKSQETAQKITLMLEDQRSKNNDSGDSWGASFKSLEERIANQEKAAATKAEKEEKEREAAEKKIAEQEAKIQEQGEALALEKKKSFLHKLLGK